jgi:hypothetical protein
VVTTESPTLKGYLIEKGRVEYSSKIEQEVSLDGAQELYSWSNELEYLFPSIEVVRNNALLSFWRAGALTQEDLSDNKVRHNMLGSAYPYRLP